MVKILVTIQVYFTTRQEVWGSFCSACREVFVISWGYGWGSPWPQRLQGAVEQGGGRLPPAVTP